MITRLLFCFSLTLVSCRTTSGTSGADDSSILESSNANPALLKKCEATASTETVKKFGAYFYQNGKKFREIADCKCIKDSSRRSSVSFYCDIAALPINDNAGSVTFTAKLNGDCSRSISIDVTSEE